MSEEPKRYSFADRQRLKREARERDAARLAAGEKVDNGFFSVLDRAKARLIVRRAKIRIADRE
ncbi:MAG: hypothetical protein K2Z80_37100 [Xanthobacteraceae bacterium]|nr:hypothetical protein [Xanthobacteraceae bacterium]